MSSYIILAEDELPITRQRGVLNDVSIDIQDIFDLDDYAEWKFTILDSYDNPRVCKVNADMTRSDQNLYFMIDPDELWDLAGNQSWTLKITNSHGPQLAGKGPFIILK